MSYSARRPYMDLGKSIGELFRAPIRFMKESLEKESIFEKPYLSGEGYREMHYKPPGPDPDPDPRNYPECGTLLAIEYGECDYAVVMWKKDDWSPPLPLGYPDKGTWTVESSSYDNVPCFDYIISYFDSATYVVGAGTLEGGPGIKFKINPEGAIPDETNRTIGHCHFHITHKTEWGEICRWEWHIECPLECTEVNLVVLCESDSVQLGKGSACDEVARGSCVAVYVGGEIGGEPEYRPYKWTISGTGFHFDDVAGPTTKTSATAATIVLICADNTACGTGTVTVTDACGNTGTDYIRCTTGQWVNQFLADCPDDDSFCSYCHNACISYFPMGKDQLAVASANADQCDCGTTGNCPATCGEYTRIFTVADAQAACSGDDMLYRYYCDEWQC